MLPPKPVSVVFYSLAVVNALPFLSASSLWGRSPAVAQSSTIPSAQPVAEGQDSCPAVPRQKQENAVVHAESQPTSTGATVSSTSAPARDFSGQTHKLPANVHWTVNKKVASNVVPIQAKANNKMYYGSADPNEAGYFGYMNYKFNVSSVNLDHSQHVDFQLTENQELKMDFTDKTAFDMAKKWDVENGLLLIADVKGCLQDATDDRCFFNTTKLDFDEKNQSVLAQGKAVKPEDIADEATIEFGWYEPNKDAGNANARRSPSASGLATAAAGPSFDETLDDTIGYSALSADSERFLDTIFPKGAKPPSLSCSSKRAGVLHSRALSSSLGAYVVESAKESFQAQPRSLKPRLEKSKSTDINIDLPGGLPIPIPTTKSPFGDNAILIFTTGASQDVGTAGEVKEHLNVFCVDCSAKGTVTLTGTVNVKFFGGIKEASVNVKTNDLKLNVNVGVDARITLEKTVGSDLFSLGLPGLSFGPVDIGPFIKIASSIDLQASAQGTLLVGGELDFSGSEANLDVVNKDNNKGKFDPKFSPKFEATGRLLLSAAASLPVSLEIGIKVAKFDKSVALIDTPIIKGVAQVAASVGTDEAGGFKAGIANTNGCTGISTTLSIQNKLDVNVLDIKNFNLFDTGEHPLAQGCIALGPDDSAPPGNFPNDTQASTRRYAPIRTRNSKSSIMACDSKPQVHNSDYTLNLSPLATTDGKTMVVSCADDNLYAVVNSKDAPKDCTAQWATDSQGAIGFNKGLKPMHFYSDSMRTLGVSRVRTSAASKVPKNAEAVVMVPTTSTDGSSVYVAAANNQQIFHAVACDFADGSSAKVFLTKDVEAGIKTLQSDDSIESVTGSTVTKCLPLSLAVAA